MRCSYYVGPGYVSNWGFQNNTMRYRRHTNEMPPSTEVNDNRKYLSCGAWTDLEMQRKRRVTKYKSYELLEKKSLRKRFRSWLKNKYGKIKQSC